MVSFFGVIRFSFVNLILTHAFTDAKLNKHFFINRYLPKSALDGVTIPDIIWNPAAEDVG